MILTNDQPMILANDQQMIMGEAGLKPKLQFNPHSARLQERKGPTVMNVFAVNIIRQ